MKKKKPYYLKMYRAWASTGKLPMRRVIGGNCSFCPWILADDRDSETWTSAQLVGIGYVDAKGEEINKGINTMLYGNNK